MTSPGANSGIYVHTKWQGPGWPAAGYELQVINSNPPAEKMNGYVEHKMTGSIYAVRNNWRAPVADNVWFNYRIRVVGKTIQTFINDELVCEYAEPAAAFRPMTRRAAAGSGTFALQAHDPGSVVKYRNIKVQRPAATMPRRPRASCRSRIASSTSSSRRLRTTTSRSSISALSPPAGDASRVLERRAPPRRDARQRMPAVALADPGHRRRDRRRTRRRTSNCSKAARPRVPRSRSARAAPQSIDEARLKARLQAIKAAGSGWKDFWVPGKN